VPHVDHVGRQVLAGQLRLEKAVGRWRRYRRQLAPVLPVLEPWIRRLGYAG